MGVGLDTSSIVAASWLPRRFSRPVETQRRFRAPIWCPLGGGGTREAGDTVAESLVGSSSTRKRVVACIVG